MIHKQDRAVFLHLFQREIQHRGIADVGNKPPMRAFRGNNAVPVADQGCQNLARPVQPTLPDFTVRIAQAGQIKAGLGPKILSAMRAKTHAMPRPAIGKNGVDIIAMGNFLDHIAHEDAVVVAPGTSHEGLGIGPVPAQCALGRDRNPFRVRLSHIGMNGVRINAGNDMHAPRPRARHQVAEGIAVAQMAADMLQGDLAGVIGDIAARRQTGGVGLGLVKNAQPEV